MWRFATNSHLIDEEASCCSHPNIFSSQRSLAHLHAHTQRHVCKYSPYYILYNFPPFWLTKGTSSVHSLLCGRKFTGGGQLCCLLLPLVLPVLVAVTSTLLYVPLPHCFLIALPTRRNAASTGSSQCCVVVVFIAVVYPSDRWLLWPRLLSSRTVNLCTKYQLSPTYQSLGCKPSVPIHFTCRCAIDGFSKTDQYGISYFIQSFIRENSKGAEVCDVCKRGSGSIRTFQLAIRRPRACYHIWAIGILRGIMPIQISESDCGSCCLLDLNGCGACCFHQSHTSNFS